MCTKAEIAIIQGIVPLFLEAAQGQEVARGFSHLFFSQHEKLSVEPVLNPGRLACGGLALGDLIAVVYGDVVDTPTVDVELLSEVLHAHGAALNMPARIPPSPWRVPQHGLMLELRAGEPEYKIVGILLIGIDSDSGTCLQILPHLSGEFSEVGRFSHIEVDITAAPVGEPRLLNTDDQIDHVLDVVGRPAGDVRLRYVEGLQIPEKGFLVELGDFPDALSLLPGTLQHLVLPLIGIIGQVPHIGDVHDMFDLVTEETKGTDQQVLENIGAQVADVGVLIHGRAAGIQPHLVRHSWYELLSFSTQGVEKHKRHPILLFCGILFGFALEMRTM